MGWFATYRALISEDGRGAYGTVKESLRGECDPSRTLYGALGEISFHQFSKLGPRAKGRVAYYRRRARLQPISQLPKKQP